MFLTKKKVKSIEDYVRGLVAEVTARVNELTLDTIGRINALRSELTRSEIDTASALGAHSDQLIDQSHQIANLSTGLSDLSNDLSEEISEEVDVLRNQHDMVVTDLEQLVRCLSEAGVVQILEECPDTGMVISFAAVPVKKPAAKKPPAKRAKK